MSPIYPLATSSWDQAEQDALQRVIDSDMYSMGPRCAPLKKNLPRILAANMR